MFCMVLSRLVIVVCSFSIEPRTAAPVCWISPCVVPISVLIDSVISRTFFSEFLMSSASVVVMLSTVAAM